MNVTQFPSLFAASRKWLDKTERTLLSSVFGDPQPNSQFQSNLLLVRSSHVLRHLNYQSVPGIIGDTLRSSRSHVVGSP